MDWLQFIASLIGSLAWPVTVLIIIWILRVPIAGLVPLLQKLKYKDFEVDFGSRVDAVADEVSAGIAQLGAGELTAAASDRMARLAQVSPRSAVLEAWRAVESAAEQAARRLGGAQFTGRPRSNDALRFLETSGTIDSEIAEVLGELRSLRNDAVHAPEFGLTPELANRYARAASRVAAYLEGAGGGA